MASLATSDRTVRLWERASGRLRAEWRLDVPSVSLAFVHGGRFLAVGGQDGVIRLLDAQTGMAAGQLRGHSAAVAWLDSVQDGRVLVSGTFWVLLTGTTNAPTQFIGDGTVLVWDMTRVKLAANGPKPTKIDPDALWNDLIGDDAAKAFAAIGRLAAEADVAVPLLKERLPGVASGRRMEAADLGKLIDELDDDQYIRRERASFELERAGAQALPALTEALARTKSREVRRRASEVVEKINRTPALEGIRAARGVEVLERTGGRAANELLGEWARGPEWSPLAREAKASHARLTREGK
jgi:hypothetical protein